MHPDELEFRSIADHSLLLMFTVQEVRLVREGLVRAGLVREGLPFRWSEPELSPLLRGLALSSRLREQFPRFSNVFWGNALLPERSQATGPVAFCQSLACCIAH
ncbi:hypothetical protein O77CONTIG1_02240 [Leptolyngbya sp. O-77]|nr:hypothetical protein O77CONTIG1_02240 [Leptolyngbya sp. O-77]